MKKTLLAASVAAFGLAFAPVTFAADGTITFTGTVWDGTCTVTGGSGTNGGTKDFTVQLQPVMVSALKTNGDRAGDQLFQVKLGGQNCQISDGKVAKLWWETSQSGASIDTATGRLKNLAAGGAGNVQIGLQNQNRVDINIVQNTNPSTTPIANKDGTLTYYAQYVATGGAATAGAVNTNVIYSVSYQ